MNRELIREAEEQKATGSLAGNGVEIADGDRLNLYNAVGLLVAIFEWKGLYKQDRNRSKHGISGRRTLRQVGFSLYAEVNS